MHENEISEIVLDKSILIHRELGPGLYESVYETILIYELSKVGLNVESQVELPIQWDGRTFNRGFRIDLVVNGQVLIELKSVARITDVHRKQVTTYLKLTGLKLGLLINFNDKLLKRGYHRIVNGLEE